MSCFTWLQVRIAESEKDIPLYVVIRKWIQNDPDSEIMPMPAHGDDLAEAKRSMAPKLPPVPRLPEEPKLETRPKEAPVTSHADEPASVEVRCPRRNTTALIFQSAPAL